jgi:hypothetical protein
MGGRNDRNVKPSPKVYPLASEELREIREWLRATYGGYWGGLYSVAIQVEKMEKKLAAQEKKIRKLEARIEVWEKGG